MALNIIWISFFLLAFVAAVIKLAVQGNTDIFKTIVDAVFATANTSVEISIGLIGVMSLFLGFMNIGERAGAIGFLSRIVGPFFSRLFPDLPKNHPAMGHMMMNFSANLLGLDNAATPFGLKAMQSMQEVNPDKDTASNAQIMFMVLHASGLTLIPVSIIAQRIIANSKDATSIFIPCLIATFIATVVAMVVVAIRQRINLFQPVIMLWVGGITFVLALMMRFMHGLSQEGVSTFSKLLSNGIIFLIFVVFILGAIRKRVPVFETFIEGAKQGFEIAVKIIPYLVAMLVAISVLRTSGVFDYILQALAWFFSILGINTDFVPALPVALMKPLSGSGARGMMIEIIQNPAIGPDSFVGQLACIFNGTSDTTFYIVALYFGSVGIKNTRYAIPAALLADLAGIIASICLAYFFFAR